MRQTGTTKSSKSSYTMERMYCAGFERGEVRQIYADGCNEGGAMMGEKIRGGGGWCSNNAVVNGWW